MSNEKKDLTKDLDGPVGDVKPKYTKRLKVCGPDNMGFWYLGWTEGGELPKAFKNNKYIRRDEAEWAARLGNVELGND